MYIGLCGEVTLASKICSLLSKALKGLLIGVSCASAQMDLCDSLDSQPMLVLKV